MVISTRASKTDPTLLRALLNESSHSLFLIEAETGRFLDASDRAADLIGYGAEELIGQRLEDCLHAESMQITTKEFLESLRRDGSAFVGVRFLHRNGSTVTVRMDIDYVDYNQTEYLLAIADKAQTDDSDPDRALRFESLYENSFIPCVIYDLSPIHALIESYFEPNELAGNGSLALPTDFLMDCRERATLYGTNEAALNFFDGEEEAPGRFDLLERLSPQAGLNHVVKALLDGGYRHEFKTELDTADERDIPVRIEMILAPDHEQRWGRVYFTVHDLSERRQVKKELTRNERTFDQITEEIDQIVWMFDSYMENLLYQSGPVEDIYGCSPADIEQDARVLMQMIHPDDRGRVQQKLDRLIDGESIDVEYRVNPHENYGRWAWTQGIPLEDDDGLVERIAGFTKDITSRKRMESSLRETKERFEALFEQASVGMAEISPDGRWLKVNERLTKTLGYDKNEFYQRTLSSLTHPEDLAKENQLRSNLLDGDIEKYTHEKRFFHKNGEPIWMKHTSSLVRDDDGEPLYYISILEDIRDRRRAEEKLKRREEMYRNLVSDVPGIVYRCLADEDWTMRFMSDTVEDIAGYPREEFIDNWVRSYRSIIHPDDRQTVRNQVESSLDVDEPFEVEHRIRTRSGDYRWVLVRGRAIPKDGEEAPVLHGVIVDVTDLKETQRELQTSEKRFRSVFERAKVGMAEISFSEEWLSVNERLETILGYSEEELIGSRCRDITHPDSIEEDERCARELIEGESTHFTSEKRYRHKEGHWVWVRMTVSRVDEPRGGHEGYFIAIIEDISERKQTEEELRKSERQFRELAENIDEVFWLLDPEDEQMLYVSSAVEDLCGIKPEELYENPRFWLERVHPEDQDRISQNIEQKQRSGRYDEEYRFVLPDGSIRWVNDRAFPIKDDDGNIQRIAGIIEDITWEKRIQAEQETFFHISLDLFALANYEGEFMDVNPAFTDVLGYSRSELTSKPYVAFVHPDDVEKTRDEMRKLTEGESVEGFENRYLTKDGSVRWLNWRAEPGEDLVYAVARDVTERHRYEEQLQEMVDEKETLLKEIHHRVKNNLQMISSLLDMQMREIDRETVREKLRDSVNRIKSMALIHENLYQSENIADFDFERYIEELTERTLGVHHQEPGNVTLEYDVDSDPLDLNHAIPCGLVLNELVSNTLEHGIDPEDDTSTIRIAFTNRGSEASLVVEDNGQGFESDFDPDDTGTFGMQIVRSLVEYELNGSLSVENDDGAVVDITFPLD